MKNSSSNPHQQRNCLRASIPADIGVLVQNVGSLLDKESSNRQ
ncbi:hypothetical protein O9992_03215 [Vibrio lentus]|nr:hypothetical protein [Vibrio lentus]